MGLKSRKTKDLPSTSRDDPVTYFALEVDEKRTQKVGSQRTDLRPERQQGQQYRPELVSILL